MRTTTLASRSVVAVGVFDGLHLGHRAILGRARERAREAGARSVVLSFDPHPEVVLSKGAFRFPAPLTPPLEKRARILAMGMDEFVVLPFTRELAALTAEEFVAVHLVGGLKAQALVVGREFALGRDREGTVERLREIGSSSFEVEAVPLLRMDGEPVSSTRIRTCLSQGRVAEAARLLGRPYGIEGSVVTGHGLGKTLGYPTANLRLHEEKLLPADGIYAGRVLLAGEARRRPAALSIGTRPTFDGRVRQVEAFLLDWSGDLVGREVEMEFADWLRPEIKFASAAELVAAMARDVQETRRRLSTEDLPGVAEVPPEGGASSPAPA